MEERKKYYICTTYIDMPDSEYNGKRVIEEETYDNYETAISVARQGYSKQKIRSVLDENYNELTSFYLV